MTKPRRRRPFTRLALEAGLASKLASAVVHAQEYLEGIEDPQHLRDYNAVAHDLAALKSVVYDAEVVTWLAGLGPLAPVKR